MLVSHINVHLEPDTQVELNQASVENRSPWVIVHVGPIFGGIDLVGTPEQLLAFARKVRDAAHDAELAQMVAEVAS